ncbi:hypothetical protein CS063_04215 [Sporanaerobium hydrogeniformans]|uniref:Uncharacterized protein n=1 Tax=Sporanaerobium hydrogeniformans TaxID=3072179 RepID=A0AC61DFT2_9FIRM|nr:hypothetical protein [Sporanaerobium hydrogeniformans]PHV71770.1 hypothetical protein CS063_04215 [Sporanaerobium hydrogeniformans]
MRIRNNKKVTFWLIGLGCGMIISGITMMVYILSCESAIREIVKENEVHAEKQTDEIKAQQIEIPSNEKISSALQELKQEISGLKKETQEEEGIEKSSTLTDENQNEKIKVFISKRMNAIEICKLLKEAGVIEDEKNFFDYVSAQNKTRYLKSGVLEFEKEASNEEILAILAIR